jgi:DNA-binding response OmpR family regulator
VATREVWVRGRSVALTGLEFDILVALMRRAGRVVPRESLLSEAGRDDVAVGPRTVDVHISKLRKKLGDDPRSPAIIRTVRGVGYVMADRASDTADRAPDAAGDTPGGAAGDAGAR